MLRLLLDVRNFFVHKMVKNIILYCLFSRQFIPFFSQSQLFGD
jgi:hypothetical protein